MEPVSLERVVGIWTIQITINGTLVDWKMLLDGQAFTHYSFSTEEMDQLDAVLYEARQALRLAMNGEEP